MPLSRYLTIYPCPEKPGSFLLYSTKKGAVVRLSAALLAAARAGTLAPAEAERLRRLEIVVDDPAAERAAMAAAVERTNLRRRRFNALVVLNLDCNLACPYCYEDPFRGRHFMAPETAQLLVETVRREQLAEGREVALEFYGGEALLSRPLLREIAAPLGAAARELGVKFSFGLVTNGTLLTRAVAEELLPLGLSGASITLDGPREVHDRQRPFVSGKGSFDTILANVKAVWDLVPLRIGGNFGRDSYREFPRLLDQLLAEGITPEKVRAVQFSPIIPKAGGGAATDHAGCFSANEPWLVEAALYLREEILRRGFDTPKPTMAACMVEFANDLVVNYDGTLYKCPAFMGWPELAVGTLADGVGDYAASHNLNVWRTDDCLDCPYLPLCFGGCRLLRKLRTGAIDGVDCRRDFFAAALEQLVRQDLELRRRA